MAWYRSTTNTTGITTFDTPANALSVLNTFFTACAAEGASFLWTVASYQSTSPRYLVLKRKDASAGRLMFFGGDTPNAAQLLGVTANTTSLYVVYDRLATTDTPTNAYTGATLVWGGSTANLHKGRVFGGLSASSSELRAYCNSTNDALAVFWTDSANNVMRGQAIVGLWGRNEAGTASELLTTCGSNTFANGVIVEPVSVNLSSASSTNGIAVATVYNATSNEIVRVACHQTAASSFAASQAIQNERMLSPGGYVKIFPYTFVVLSGGIVTENRLYSTRNIGWGPMKQLGFQWTDNASAAKGYYIGWVNSSSDLSGLSFIDDSF